jgi:hypothetical protein
MYTYHTDFLESINLWSVYDPIYNFRRAVRNILAMRKHRRDRGLPYDKSQGHSELSLAQNANL